MSFSFMTVLIFSSIILLVLYSLSEYSSGRGSPYYSQLYLVKNSNECNLTTCTNKNDVNYKIKIEEKDSIIIFAYIVILFGIIFPNLNQIE